MRKIAGKLSKFMGKSPYNRVFFGQLAEKPRNFTHFLDNYPDSFSKKTGKLKESAAKAPEILNFLQGLSENIDNFNEKSDFLAILSTIQHINSHSKRLSPAHNSLIWSFRREIISKINEKMLKDLKNNDFFANIQKINEKHNVFEASFLKELSETDRLEFIKFLRKIDNFHEFHNTNVINRFITAKFAMDLQMKKKKFRSFLPFFSVFSVVSTLLYSIWLFYYCFEYDVWLFDPRVTDYHVYRFS